jgi:hypothetical protein
MKPTLETTPPNIRPPAIVSRLRCRLAIACAFASILLAPASAATAASLTWAEAGDAGQTIPTAQTVTGSPSDTLTAITGNISAASDHDLYEIYIANGATFSATTVLQPGTLDDTQLFLFNSAGIGVYANDDDATALGANAFRSTLPAGGSPTLITPGLYYLLIDASFSFPTSDGGLIFPNLTRTSVPVVDSTAVVGPTGPGGASPFTGYTGTASSFGTYTIALTGATFVTPEPATVVMMFAGSPLLVGYVLLSRRRRATRAVDAAA